MLNESDIRVCIVGIGQLGIEAVRNLQAHLELPIQYGLMPSKAYDIVVLVCGPDAGIVETITTLADCFNTEQLVLTYPRVPEHRSPEFYKLLQELKRHTAVIITTQRVEDRDWPQQLALTIKSLIGPLFRHSLDFAELKYILAAEGTVGLTFYATASGDDCAQQIADQAVQHLKTISVLTSAVLLHFFYAYVMEPTELDSILAFILKDISETTAVTFCNTHEPNLGHDICLFMLITEQGKQ